MPVETSSGPNPKYEDPPPRTDGPSDRGLGGDLERVPCALSGRAVGGPDGRPRTRPPNTSGSPPSCRPRLPLRGIGRPRVVLLPLCQSAWYPEPEAAAESTRHRGAVRMDPKSDRGVSFPRGARSRLGRGLAGSRPACVPARDSANLLIRHEERTLELRFGAEYRAYRESVPRWIPRPPRRQR